MAVLAGARPGCGWGVEEPEGGRGRCAGRGVCTVGIIVAVGAPSKRTWLPGAVYRLSMRTGPFGTSTSNRCTCRAAEQVVRGAGAPETRQDPGLCSGCSTAGSRAQHSATASAAAAADSSISCSYPRPPPSPPSFTFRYAATTSP